MTIAVAIRLTACLDIGTPRETLGPRDDAASGKFLDRDASNPHATRSPHRKAFRCLPARFSRAQKSMLLRTKIVHHASQLHKVQAIKSRRVQGPPKIARPQACMPLA
jgi:hypothetical protein